MKLTLNDVGSLIDATTAQTTINNNNDAIETAFENTLSRDGTAPNKMSSLLDMDSHQILNLPVPVSANSPLRLQDLDDFVGGGTVSNIPAGGATHDVLTKASSASYDIEWFPASQVTAGSNVVINGVSPQVVGVIDSPNFQTSVTTPLLNLNGYGLQTKTGTGSLVLQDTPAIANATLVAPALGIPISGDVTHLTGTAAGVTAGNVTTNANLTGDVTSVGNATTLTNAPVISKVLTGYTSGAGTVSASDSILSAIQKLNGNDATNANLTGEVTSVGNATTLTNAPVIAKVLTGFASGAGTVSAADSILSAFQKIDGNVALKAPLTSPALTGTPIAPTAAVDTNTTQLATTAMVLAQAASATPLGNAATAAVGTSTRFARGDHVHPTSSWAGPPVFSAGDYTASGSMTWTVVSGNITNLRYFVYGKKMTIEIDINGTTVGGTLNNSLQIKIPGGFLNAFRQYNPAAFLVDNSVRVAGYFDTGVTGGNVILVRRLDLANWSASAGQTSFSGQITFEIQ